jgi:hypothetical protein
LAQSTLPEGVLQIELMNKERFSAQPGLLVRTAIYKDI